MDTTAMELLARDDVCEGITNVSGDKGIPIYRYGNYVIHIDAIDGLAIEIQLHVHLWDLYVALTLIPRIYWRVQKSHLHIAVTEDTDIIDMEDSNPLN